MPNGMNSARKLKKNHKKQKYKKQKRHPPFRLGGPQARGIVIKGREIEPKQPNSGKRKCFRIKLIRDGVDVTAFAPGNHAFTFIDEHDEVVIEGIGGSKGKSYGDLPGVRFKITKVNDVPLLSLVTGKAEKPIRR